MAYWIRDATLTIGKKQYSLDGLDFSFEIPFEDSDDVPVATVKVTNLSENTRKSIKKNTTVILNAGYEDDIGCILVGKVIGLKHKQSNVDWITTMTVQPNADKILKKKINKTYKKGIKAKAMVRDMLNIFGVEVTKFTLTKNKSYPRGRVCKGNLKKILTTVVVKECKSRFIIRPTGQIYITKSGGGIDNHLILTDKTGLLRSDEEKEPIPIKTKTTTTKKSKDKKDNTISRTCLLNYRVATAEVVRIRCEDLKGKFTVVAGKHKGSRTGDWVTEMELKPH